MNISKKGAVIITVLAVIIIMQGILNLSYIMKKSTQGEEKERKILYWQAPMDPNYTSDKPGKSPMGMDLIPVYADEQEEMSESEGEYYEEKRFRTNYPIPR